MLSLRCPLLSASNLLLCAIYIQLSHPRRARWRESGGAVLSLSPGWYGEHHSVNITALHRLPLQSETASCSETRFPERHKYCQSEFKLDFNRHVPSHEAQRSIFRTIPAYQFMGIKQPTDLLLQAILGEGGRSNLYAPTIIWAHTLACAVKHGHAKTGTNIHTHKHYTHHLRAHSSLRGALRPVAAGAIFVGFCEESVCESVWVSNSANVWEGFLSRQEKTPVFSVAPACLHIRQPTEWTF